MRGLIAGVLTVLWSVPVLAGDVVLSPNNLEQIQIEKLNTEAGKKIVETPNTPKVKEEKKPTPPPDYSLFLTAFSYDSNVPVVAKGEVLTTESKSNAKQSNSQPQKVQSPQSSQTKPTKKEIELKGLCQFTNTLEITTLTMPVELVCSFDKGVGTLYGLLMPDFKTYSLVLKPQQVKLNGKTYAVKSGYVTTADKSSLNVADEVNRRILKKVLMRAVAEGTKEGFSAYQEYVQQKYTQVTTVGTENPVQIETHNYPSNYPVTSAVLGFIKGLTDALTQIVEKEANNVPVLFKVNAGKVVYAHLFVEGQ